MFCNGNKTLLIQRASYAIGQVSVKYAVQRQVCQAPSCIGFMTRMYHEAGLTAGT